MKGSFHQSRRQSNFYNHLKSDEQLTYAKQWVATLNSKLLEPFVKMTGATKHNREVFYEIDIERLMKVEEENQRLREVLEFYASENNHFRVDMYAESIVMQDEGKIARRALGGEAHE
ncbi:hypothetical protein [Lysinibacillus fusiformis]|uniref:hypothetical protein n=1 Tax=Lysinibacillus fusiformis TaxID=28031 RepID=UPI00148DD381|nr:hypothetical protein [Lysinibacillus fusiformis]NOG28551.1 hypothetical protein [Lysinibacillus fusiformis]